MVICYNEFEECNSSGFCGQFLQKRLQTLNGLPEGEWSILLYAIYIYTEQTWRQKFPEH